MEENNFVTLDQFKEYLTNMTSDGVTIREDGEFSFGFNWLDYVKNRMTEEIIEMHQANLKSLYDSINVDLNNKSVFDIGCGSGLSSLSFARLGCSITSMDIDEFSIEASNYTKENFFKNSTNWNIFQGSIVDTTTLPQQQFDIVYSWGVLHHTGNMWDAIRNAASMVKPGGYFHIALYRSGGKYPMHLEQKFRFKLADTEQKIQMLYDRCGQKLFSVKKGRGMNKFHDSLDWLGGLPYEVCDPEVLFAFLKDKYNFEVSYFTDRAQGGNFTAILKRNS